MTSTLSVFNCRNSSFPMFFFFSSTPTQVRRRPLSALGYKRPVSQYAQMAVATATGAPSRYQVSVWKFTRPVGRNSSETGKLWSNFHFHVHNHQPLLNDAETIVAMETIHRFNFRIFSQWAIIVRKHTVYISEESLITLWLFNVPCFISVKILLIRH